MNRMHSTVVLAQIVVLLVIATGCSLDSKQPAAGEHGVVASTAEKVNPLGTGDEVPSVEVRNIQGDSLDLRRRCLGKPTVLIFYRGGWCPYCTAHLAEVGGIADNLRKVGFQILAISPDRPRFLKKSAGEQDYDYTLLSDPKARAIRSFGLAFRVGIGTVVSYREKGLDLEKRSGQSHHILPVPAAYLIDQDGIIRYAHWDPNYKERIDGEKLLQIARHLTSSD